ncbi:MAG: T9SS type A sorting domain-containing protein [Saprospiraceae bacterium]|nr:T9SS type A sorting domain-containing protein [Saprospiraceae bacterium]
MDSGATGATFWVVMASTSSLTPTHQILFMLNINGAILFRSLDGGQSFQWARTGINESERRNWNTPIRLDPQSPTVLYYGTTRLYRSDNRAGSWVAISPDLTKGQHPSGSTSFGTITSIEVSPVNSQVIWVGTDDGNVQVTTNGGREWNLVSSNLPNRYVTSVAADVKNPLKAYVTFSGYRSVDYLSHIFLTEDGGATWQDISDNLPEVPINEVIIDHLHTNRLYVATDLGVWFTENWREGWQRLGKNLPLTVVTDLVIHQRSRTLVAATYGRSMYKFQLDRPTITLPEVADEYTTFSVAPNPAIVGTPIEIQLEKWTTGEVLIYNTNGQLVQRHLFEGKNIALPSQPWHKGVYFAQVRSQIGSQTQSFLLIEE